MPRGKSGQRPENTRELRGAAGGEAGGRAEFSDTVKKGAVSGDCAAGLGAAANAGTAGAAAVGATNTANSGNLGSANN